MNEISKVRKRRRGKSDSWLSNGAWSDVRDHDDAAEEDTGEDAAG